MNTNLRTRTIETQRRRDAELKKEGSQLWAPLLSRDVREFGIVVKRESETRLVLFEPIGYKAPSIARPYCCYINTVIFYLHPHEIVRCGKRRGCFREWERVDTLLYWDREFVFEGEVYLAGGGRVVRRNKGWWMKLWGRKAAKAEDRKTNQ